MRDGKQNQVQVPPEILAHISDIFLKYGLRSTSMDDISNHLKISKKTLYHYFENKDRLVEAVMTYRHKDFNFETLHKNILPHSAIKVLLGMIDYFIRIQKSLIPANIFDMKKYHPVVFEKISGKLDLFMQQFFAIVIDKGMTDGLFRPDINPSLQIFLLGKQMAGLRDPEKQDSFQYPIEDVIGTVMENFIRSIATAEGLAEMESLKNEPDRAKKKTAAPESQ